MAEEREAKVRLDVEAGGEPEAFADAAEEAKEFKEALDGLKNAGVDVSGIEELDEKFADLDRRVEEILTGMGDIGPEIAAAAARVGATLEQLGQKAEQGLGGGKQAAAQARLAIDDYAAAIARAREAGATIADEQIEQLRKAEEEYNAAVQRLGQLRKAEQDVGKQIGETTAQAGGQVRQFNDLGDVFDAVGGKAGKMGLQILSVYAALKTGMQIGNDLRNSVDAIFGPGTTDNLVRSTGAFQALSAAIDLVTGSSESGRERAERYNNELNILRNNGIDPTGKSAEEVSRLVEELGKKTQQTSVETANAAAAHKKWLEELELSAPVLAEVGNQLAANIGKFVEANDQLGEQQFAALFKDQIQEVLDAAARIGVEPPKDIQRYADSWGILTSAAEKAATRHRELVEQIRADIAGAAAGTKEELTAMVSATLEAISGLHLPTLEFVDPEQFERAKEHIEGVVAALRGAGEAIPSAIAGAANAVGVLVEGWEVGAAKGQEFAGAAVQVTEAVDAAGNKIVSVGNASNEAAGGMAAAAQQAQQLAGAGVSVTESFDAAGNRIVTVSNAAPQAAAGMGALADKATAAAGPIELVASHAQGLADSDAGSAANELSQGLASITQVGGNVVITLGNLVGMVGKEFAGLKGFEQPIVTGLDTILTKANAVITALQRVRDIGSAGEPPPGGQELA